MKKAQKRAGTNSSLMVGMLKPERLPDEVIQRIFLLSCFDAEGTHDAVHLQRLCSVNRRWRRAAISYCTLWTTLPPIKLESKSTVSMRRATMSMQLYLGRSGALPISFEFIASTRNPTHETPEQWAPVRTALGILIDECLRWDIVSLNLPSSGMRELQEIGGPLPCLTSLEVVTPVAFVSSSESVQDSGLNGFINAPNLRRVAYESKSGTMPWHARSLAKLPLSQLESLKSVSYNDRGVYRDILETHLNIQSIEIITYLTDAIPPDLTSTYHLPHLTFLKLYANEFHWNIATHLETLTLPSLRHLEVRCGIPDDTLAEQMYRSIKTLIRKSGCSLEHLAFSSESSNAPALTNILSMSPELGVLDISFPSTSCLGVLSFGRSTLEAPKLAPKLHTIIFRVRWNFTTSFAQGEALAQMIKSRVGALQGFKAPSTPPALREVIFLWSSEMSLRSDLAPKVSKFSYDHQDLDDQAWRDVDPWIRYKFLTSYHSRRAWVNPVLMARYERLLGNLESLDLKKSGMGTHKLMAHGFPTFLRLVGEKKGGTIPGDRVFLYRWRARRLLNKWKPFLLRDARRFRWCYYYTEGILTLKWGTVWNGRELTDEELWQEIVGLDRPGERSYHRMGDWRS